MHNQEYTIYQYYLIDKPVPTITVPVPLCKSDKIKLDNQAKLLDKLFNNK